MNLTICHYCGFAYSATTSAALAFHINDHDCGWWPRFKWKWLKIRSEEP